MSFSPLFLLLRLPLAVLICGPLLFLGGDFSPDDYLASPGEVEVAFEERDDNESFDAGLPGVIFEDPLIQQSNGVSSDVGSVPQGVPLELHATGPPNV